MPLAPDSTAIRVSGPLVLQNGRVLPALCLEKWKRDADADLPPGACSRALVRRAAADGQVLCARPSEDSPARFGLSLEEALDMTYHDGARLFAVDPYDADGAPICYQSRRSLVRFAATPLPLRRTG